ncbi:MAG TPA: FkbM family methyltransferase [Acidimicrobiales bacterium]|nr:FkbM family methyltransferase [Acidimicrobiales bacterium]
MATTARVRSVPSDLGPLDAVEDDVFVPWMTEYATWEVAEATLLRRWLRPSMTFLDVGAHVGYFTLLARECVGKRGTVIAIEPEPENYAVLVQNVRARHARNVATVNAAAWSVPGRLGLARSPRNSGDHRVRVDDSLAQVDAIVLDAVLPPTMRIDVVKIDTQGTDHHVVRGLVSTLARWRPRLVVEFWPPAIADVDPATLPGEYRALGYHVAALEATLAADAAGTEFVRAAADAEHEFLTLVLEPLPEANS